MLEIYNSLTREKDTFNPINSGKINLYVCGVTTYDVCHMGHARVLICFDVMVRFLRYIGYKVKYIRNITDIDDKIIKRVNESGEPFSTFVQKYIDLMHEDTAILNILTPDEEPRATQFIPKIIELIQKLIENGCAYVVDNGDVYYDVNRFKKYGKLSNRNLEKLRAGARVEISDVKHDPLDFVLWKAAKPNEPNWDSPWGKGRPGWHIECSAMALAGFDGQVDIHGGGADLLFPHHENEIAQSEGATGKPFVNYWVHIGYLQINREKMSKSLGNFFTIREVLKKYPPEVIRYFMVASHYRSPINYTDDGLNQARQSLERLYTSLRGLDLSHTERNSEFEKYFISVMNDDFNTPKALAVLFDLAHEINRIKETDQNKANLLGGLLKGLGELLGILQLPPEDFLQSGDLDIANIEKLIDERNRTRRLKQFKRADEIRDELLQMGVILEDQSGKTIWRKK